MEKEQAYKDAAANYEMAWKYGNQTNPTIGTIILSSSWPIIFGRKYLQIVIKEDLRVSWYKETVCCLMFCF